MNLDPQSCAVVGVLEQDTKTFQSANNSKLTFDADKSIFTTLGCWQLKCLLWHLIDFWERVYTHIHRREERETREENGWTIKWTESEFFVRHQKINVLRLEESKAIKQEEVSFVWSKMRQMTEKSKFRNRKTEYLLIWIDFVRCAPKWRWQILGVFFCGCVGCVKKCKRLLIKYFVLFSFYFQYFETVLHFIFLYWFW